MEATGDSLSRYGRPIERERDGYGGGGQLFIVRRESDFLAGLLSEKGHGNNYLVFKPTGLFVRSLGDVVLRLNQALFEFRGDVVDHILVLGEDGVEGHYAELDQRTGVVRDRLVVLTECCNKGFDGRYKEALEGIRDLERLTPEVGNDGDAKKWRLGSEGRAAFDRVRVRNLEEGVLTDDGQEQGYVAFKACPLYGRLVGEIIYTLNDGLRRMEDRASHYILNGVVGEGGEGEVKLVIEFVETLGKVLGVLRGDVEEVIAFCQQKVV